MQTPEERRRDIYIEIQKLDIEISRCKARRTLLDAEYIKLGAINETTKKVVQAFEPVINTTEAEQFVAKYGFQPKTGPIR